MVSDLAGDSIRLSWSGSPTVNPFKLDAIICNQKSSQFFSPKLNPKETMKKIKKV
jgi:hypothetical protein